MNETTLSEKYWNELCRVGMGDPLPLNKADLSQPFVYSRPFGIFYVDFGRHQLAMSTLLAWQNGMVKAIDIAEKMKLKFTDETADYWLKNTSGSAYKSSVGREIYAGKRENLNAYERRAFRKVVYLFEDDTNS